MENLLIKIGCCGFPISKAKYYQNFSLVEVNSTFYNYPKLNVLSKWRDDAPSKFEFTVKAHQDVSHTYRFSLPDCDKAVDQMVEACKVLNSQILLIQTPASFKPDSINLSKIRRFFRKMRKHPVTWVWETRGSEWTAPQIKSLLEDLLKKSSVIHCTDPFVNQPVHVEEIAYFRLHGLGDRMYYYQYSNEELQKLMETLQRFRKCRIYVLFNNLTMYIDALRFSEFLRNAEFPSVTGHFGLESFRKIVEKTRFPITKSMLTRTYGWRLLDIELGKQARLKDVVEKMPGKTYPNLERLLEAAAEALREIG